MYRQFCQTGSVGLDRWSFVEFESSESQHCFVQTLHSLRSRIRGVFGMGTDADPWSWTLTSGIDVGPYTLANSGDQWSEFR